MHAMQSDYLGLGRRDPVVKLDGTLGERRRVYLDSAATTLMARDVHEKLTRYLEVSCANSHTHAHRAGRATTNAIDRARQAVGTLVGYDPALDSVLFTGNGATGALNYLSRALFPPELRHYLKTKDPLGSVRHASAFIDPRRIARLCLLAERPLVVTTVMEHHSNLLPWVEAVGRHNCRFIEVTDQGLLDLADLKRVLAGEGPRVRLVTVAGVSNVTGVRNPVHEIAGLAHSVGAEIAVDAAQMGAHAALSLHAGGESESIDYVALSGHKMYAPGSRGALVGRLSHAVGAQCVGDVGGGMVESVSIDDYVLKDDLTAREEAGTPNIPGTIGLGLAAARLLEVGLSQIESHEAVITERALDALSRIDGVKVYGPSWSLERRAGVITFNVNGLAHGLVAAFLNDTHAIAVRNECFCAHPYVKRLLGVTDAAEAAYLSELAEGERRNVPGMVRASFGMYSALDDVEALAEGLAELTRERERVLAAYRSLPNGNYMRVDAPRELDLPPVFG
jgi:cysteine desulfurase / selenocysteine lyase